MLTRYRPMTAGVFGGLIVALLLTACLVACTTPPASPTSSPPAAAASATPVVNNAAPTPLAKDNQDAVVERPAPTAAQSETAATPTAPPTMAITPGPAGRCGLYLPAIAPVVSPATTELNDSASLEAFPVEVRPAVAHILNTPGDVGLVAYRVGEEAEGAFLNAEIPMPLASVVKIIHLIAYTDAVMAGEIDPATRVPLADLEAFYLPNSDLGAHPAALSELRAEGRILDDPPAVLLEDVPRMMIQYSSNAATDYLHMLLGQERIERTIIDLGLNQQAAPCPFIGQFLSMNDPNGAGSARDHVIDLIADPRRYSIEVMNLTAQYVDDVQFRADVGGWRGRSRRPSLATQQLFAENLNAQGSARDYADLMARIARNDLGAWEQMVLIRRYLEWPTFFPDNQELMAWLGYKGGSLPGVLTATYYAQPWWRTEPVVVALFFRDLPNSTYQRWRRDLPHDELARWLLREPDAIPLLRSLLEAAP